MTKESIILAKRPPIRILFDFLDPVIVYRISLIPCFQSAVYILWCMKSSATQQFSKTAPFPQEKTHPVATDEKSYPLL